MPEIPTNILDKNTWNILPSKIDIYDHPDKSHHLLVLLLRKGLVDVVDRIIHHYTTTYKDYIKGVLHNEYTTNKQLQTSIRMSIYEYIGHQKKSIAIQFMKRFEIHFNYTIFRCCIKADNYALFSMLVAKKYPIKIKKHNDEIYHIMNDTLNMTIMTETMFGMLMCNILSAYKYTKISLLTYIRILKRGYYQVCKKMECYVDVHIWNGRELQNELDQLREDMNHLYKHVYYTFIHVPNTSNIDDKNPNSYDEQHIY